MKLQELPTDQELALILRDDVRLFMQALFEAYSGKIMAYLGKVSWDVLNEHELADAFQETMRDVWQRVGEDAANETDITDLVIADMEGTDLAQRVKAQSTEQRRRFEETLPELLAELPERQRAAATAFLECYADIREGEKWEKVAEAMSALRGEPITADAARSALRAALAKLRAGLLQRGLEFGDLNSSRGKLP